MRLVIKINMENAAFEGADCVPEVVRILGVAADKVRRGQVSMTIPDSSKLLDVNGNSVGSVSTEETDR